MPNVTRTNKSKVAFYLQELPNGTLKSDWQVEFSKSYEKQM